MSNQGTKAMPKERSLHPMGHLVDFKTNLLPFLRQMVAKHPEIVQLRGGPRKIFLVHHPDLVREILVKQVKNFPKARFFSSILSKGLGNGIITSAGNFHSSQRRMMQPAFRAKRLNTYAETMTRYTADMLDEWQHGQEVDIHNEMMRLTMFIVSKTLFNADKETMAAEAERAANAISVNQELMNREFWLGFDIPMWIPNKANRTFRQSTETLSEILTPIIEARRQGKDDVGDLLSILVNAEDDEGEPMSDEQIFDEVNNLFSAGHETTANALTWTFYMLAQHPDIAADVADELDQVLQGRTPTIDDLARLPLLEMVLKESMRMYPAIWSLGTRETQQTTQVGGYTIPKNSLILIPVFSLHRQEAFYPDPEKFDPTRFDPEFGDEIPRYAYLPFGAGPRVCIGGQFAMIEACLILAQTLQKFRIELMEGQTVTPKPLVTMGPADGLHVRLVERDAGTNQFQPFEEYVN
ncbi:MAG: cytochrome P450 [Chloroflexota bacterium]